MTHIDERWGLFIDFAATFHETLADTKIELDIAAKADYGSYDELELVTRKLQGHWKNLQSGLEVFRRVSEVMLQSDLTPKQIILTAKIVEKIHEAATLTDASLRVFFEKTQLVRFMPSRKMAGEDIYSDPKKVQ